ncbi:MAG: hypothetical protein B9S34_05045 [Opitutia bacterium Tous-C1TDCM]|nr:MAG: hypothetical protein B9S34_05045 [Opitutae bacterium Tous-C1TDCM]
MSRGEWLLTGLVAAELVWSTVTFGGYRPEFRLVAYALTGAALLVLAIQRARERGPVGPAHPAGFFLLPFVGWAALNAALVSPVPWLAWPEWLGWANLAALFWIVLNGIRSGRTRGLLFGVLVGLALAGVAAGCYQRFMQPAWQPWGGARTAFLDRASGTFAIPNSFAGLILLVVPGAAALAFRRGARETERVWWVWVVAVLLVGLGLTISRGAWLALAIAIAAWPLAAGRGAWRRRLALSALGVLLLGGGAAWLYRQSPAVRERIGFLVRDGGEVTRPAMWQGAWRLFRDAPVFGNGAGSYNVLFERHRPEGFRDEPLYAHNEYLNVLADHGATGAVLLFGGWAAIAWRCRRRGDAAGRSGGIDSRTVGAGLAAGLAAFALQLGLDFHLRIPALAAAFAVVGALAVAARWRLPEPTISAASRHRWLPAAGLGLGLAVVAGTAGPLLVADALRRPARAEIDRLGALGSAVTAAQAKAVLAASRAALERAVEWAPRHGQAWSDLSYAIALTARYEPERAGEWARAAEAAAERALALSAVCSEFRIRRGVARDLQGRWAEAGADFFAAVEIAKADAVAWYYLADHLARGNEVSREPAEAALAYCLKLDPNFAPAYGLRDQFEKRRRKS